MKRPCDSAPAAIATEQPTATSSRSAFTNGCAGEQDRAPGHELLELPKAMFEPQNDTEPMIAAKRIGIRASSSGMPPVIPAPRGTRRTQTSATAPPPTPLNSATICGIAVIFTPRAAGTPTAVPIATPSTISP